jgi:hypothetical protein
MAASLNILAPGATGQTGLVVENVTLFGLSC